jgi:dTDP-4-amino-4,6-dideoxygalactose transaminase
MPCDLQAILPIAARLGVPVIEDAACAIGSEVLWNGSWERLGRPHAEISCFSFHPRKLLSTGDGGMLTTRDARLDREFRLLRQHGMSVPDAVRHASAEVVFEEYPIVGFNYRMTDIQGAIGREQLKRLPAVIERRRELACRYTRALEHLPALVVPREPEWARTNWQTYLVRLGSGLDQRAVMQRLLDAGIATRRGVMNVHRERSYPAGTWRAPGPLTQSEHAQDSTIALPLFHQMSEREQDLVIDALRREAGD